MDTLEKSLYGYAQRIRNLLRGGGPSVDDDAYSIRLIAAEILSQAAAVRQAELYDLDNRGLTPDASQPVTAKLTLTDYVGAATPSKAVRLAQVNLPQALTWRGNPAVFGFKARVEAPGYSVGTSSDWAIRVATKRPYMPPKPAGWFESKALAFAFPLDYAGIKELYVTFIPAAINIRSDGLKMDEELEELTLTEQQWAKVEPLVLQSLNPMLQTTTNRDNTNQGKDDSKQ